MVRDPFTCTESLARRHGDIFKIPLPLHEMVAIAHPDLVKEVFHDRGERFGMNFPAAFENVVGPGLPFLDGKRYSERRNLYAPMFGKRFLAGMSDRVFDEFESRMGRWDELAERGEEIDLEHELGMVLLPGFLSAMFSISATDEQLERYDRDLRRTLALSASVMFTRSPLHLLPIPGYDFAPAAAFRIYREATRLINERRASGQERHDLLQAIVTGRLSDGAPVRSHAQTVDTIGLMVAGYDTVVAALSWTLALLPTNPAAKRRLQQEVATLEGRAPTFAQLDDLAWARACYDEGQRLQGNPFNPRFAKVDTELAGFSIPKGTMIAALMTALHRDPRWWANPQRFDPEHFADPAQVAARPKTAFLPFGTGPHQCVGMAMAYMNGVYLLARITQRYEIHQRPGWTPRHNMTQSVTIKGGFPCTLSHR